MTWNSLAKYIEIVSTCMLCEVNNSILYRVYKFVVLFSHILTYSINRRLSYLLHLLSLTLFVRQQDGNASDVKSWDSVMPQDSFETVLLRLDLGLDSWHPTILNVWSCDLMSLVSLSVLELMFINPLVLVLRLLSWLSQQDWFRKFTVSATYVVWNSSVTSNSASLQKKTTWPPPRRRLL